MTNSGWPITYDGILTTLIKNKLVWWCSCLLFISLQSVIWQKATVPNTGAAISCILSPTVASHLQQYQITVDEVSTNPVAAALGIFFTFQKIIIVLRLNLEVIVLLIWISTRKNSVFCPYGTNFMCCSIYVQFWNYKWI